MTHAEQDRHWHIGVCGTFDVENYGDLLFPLIAESELKERLGAITLHRFSYHEKTPPDWPFVVTSVSLAPRSARIATCPKSSSLDVAAR